MNVRRRLLHAMAAAGVLGPAGAVGLIREALAGGATPVAPGIHRIRGTVTVNGQPAREGQLLRAGDTVATGPKSEAIYVIGQDAFLQRERATVSVAGEAVANVMRLITGGLLSVFGKGEKRLEVPTATIGIRGTACYLDASEKSVYFCLCYGTAELQPKAEPGRVERIVTQYHDRPMMINNDPSLPTMWSAPVVDHSDAELTMLENLVGRWPPFYGKSGLIGY
ncbi:hypothetical protein [Azospira restricta]|nr:hypothetical protein [Azospira restricta]